MQDFVQKQWDFYANQWMHCRNGMHYYFLIQQMLNFEFQLNFFTVSTLKMYFETVFI